MKVHTPVCRDYMRLADITEMWCLVEMNPPLTPDLSVCLWPLKMTSDNIKGPSALVGKKRRLKVQFVKERLTAVSVTELCRDEWRGGGVSDDKSEPGRRTNRQQMQPLRMFPFPHFKSIKQQLYRIIFKKYLWWHGLDWKNKTEKYCFTGLLARVWWQVTISWPLGLLACMIKGIN